VVFVGDLRQLAVLDRAEIGWLCLSLCLGFAAGRQHRPRVRTPAGAGELSGLVAGVEVQRLARAVNEDRAE